MKSNCSVIIPNYCGKGLLEAHLPGLLQSLAGVGDITVVDDASTDGSVDFLRSSHPDVKLIARNVNGGFSKAVNDGIRATNGEFVLVLNNDVDLPEDFLGPLLGLFEDSETFAVTPRIVVPSLNNLDEGAKTGFWRRGLFYVDQRPDVPDVTPVLYATACASVYRRSMLQALGGFDEAYSPFYWEDMDLCYRAWKRGWKSVYQPGSTALHQHASSISKISHAYTDHIKARNALLFIWRNIEDARLLRAHHAWLPLVLSSRIIHGNRAFVSGWRAACRGLGDAINAKRRDSAFRVRSDREIFASLGIDV